MVSCNMIVQLPSLSHMFFLQKYLKTNLVKLQKIFQKIFPYDVFVENPIFKFLDCVQIWHKMSKRCVLTQKFQASMS